MAKRPLMRPEDVARTPSLGKLKPEHVARARENAKRKQYLNGMSGAYFANLGNDPPDDVGNNHIDPLARRFGGR